jgi:hypothetical protein
MNIGRTFRTVRHLTVEQWIFRFLCRGRWAVAHRFPGLFHALIDRTAQTLPLPNADSKALQDAALPVLELQNAVHGPYIADMPSGRFHFLGRTVDFGAIDQIEWRRDLGEKNNPLWRMNLSYMGWIVPLLAQGHSRALELAHTVLCSLDDQNPWQTPGVFRDVWHPYSVSHRLINLLAGLALYRAAGGASAPNAEEAIRQHARFCAAFLLHNMERDLQYNHLLKNFVALAVYRAALPASIEHLRSLERGIARSIRQQVLPDGGHAERAPMYHALCVLDLMVLRACGIACDDVLAAMKRALAVMSHPDGDIALFNDSWLGEAPRASALAAPAADGVMALPDTGYVRLGANGDAVIFDRGACGPDANLGHAHADFLAIEVSVGGQRLIVDPGVPTYSAGSLRDLCRSASQHNGPHIAGKEPIEFWQSFRVGRRGRAYALNSASLANMAPLWCAGWQDGYRNEGVVVARWAGLWPGKALLIVDCWVGALRSAPELRFFAPSSWQAGDGPAFCNGQTKVVLDTVIGERPTVTPATWWARFGEPQPAHAISVRPQTMSFGAGAATAWRWGDGRRPATAAQVKGIAEALAAACSKHIR